MYDVGIITVSDSRTAGINEDTAMPRLRALLTNAGYNVRDVALVADEASDIENAIMIMVGASAQLIVTTGGTGLGPRDVTPEATRAVITREVPGIPEAMRAGTASGYAYAWLSRAVAGICDHTLVINLPGSPRGAEECLAIALPLIPHACAMITGNDHASINSNC
jgi:molybdopterin adenylyltransferase